MNYKYSIIYPDGHEKKFNNEDDFLKECDTLKDELGLYVSDITFKELEYTSDENITII